MDLPTPSLLNQKQKILIGIQSNNQLETCMKHLPSKIIIIIIKVYQQTLSKALPSACKFSPSCSSYMIDAIKNYGFLKGIYFGIIRILKCNPFSKSSGWDPVK